MARDARDEARERLSAMAGDPTLQETEARRLERDAALLHRLLTAVGPQPSGRSAPEVTPDDLGAALSLFEGMRSQLDRLETQVIIEARRRGLDWRQIAGYQGMKSSQAASQRYQRLMTRLEEIRQGVR